MQKRRRYSQTDDLEARLAAQAQSLREQAAKLRPGPKREELLLQAQRCEDGAQMSAFLRPTEAQSQG